MNTYLRLTAPTELTLHESLQIASIRERKAQIRAAQLRVFFNEYENFCGDDGSELQRRAFELGITEAEWKEYKARKVEIEF